MRTLLFTLFSVVLVGNGLGQAADKVVPMLHTLRVEPKMKKIFRDTDGLEIQRVMGTDSTFQVGGTYRVIGVCRQKTLEDASLYLGNTSTPGPAAIEAAGGSSLAKKLKVGATDFDITFTILRPGQIHLTIYDLLNQDSRSNAYAGVYLGLVE